MSINNNVKILRELTGAGILDCKNALVEVDNDLEKAQNLLKIKGILSADKKSQRITKQGIIGSYIHTGSKIGVLIELRCETDFVAKRAEFATLARTLSMQIAANDVKYLSIEDISKEIWEEEKALELNIIENSELKTKPVNVKESIARGRIEKRLKDISLLSQKAIRDPELTVEEYIKSHIALFKENLKIVRYTKFVLGQG
jgi:elongation factor Ts